MKRLGLILLLGSIWSIFAGRYGHYSVGYKSPIEAYLYRDILRNCNVGSIEGDMEHFTDRYYNFLDQLNTKYSADDLPGGKEEIKKIKTALNDKINKKLEDLSNAVSGIDAKVEHYKRLRDDLRSVLFMMDIIMMVRL